MSDMKLYKILETFDNLDSATNKLTPVLAEATGGPFASRSKAVTDARDQIGGGKEGTNFKIEKKDDGYYWNERVDEVQTKVQTMGNKVRVTKDGDTTEFDDAETAKAMMGDDDDENQFATESEEAIAEGWGDDDFSMYGDEPDELAAYADILEPGKADVPVADFDADDLMGIEDEDDFDLDLEEGTKCMEEPEFDTFDSENESHRKRLQRGTPVVLDPELFKDPTVNRRGVFVSRSPSGDFARVVRDFDGKEIKVHLSDIKSADLVNNSIYEEYDINLEAMLAEDITMTQTTNLEEPENDTTTVTAVGQEAGEELAAMMANAGLNAGNFHDPADDIVDTGEPEVPAEPGMQDMIGMIDGPVEEDEFGRDQGAMYDHGDDWYDDDEPSDSDLDAIESDPEWDLGLDEDEDYGPMSGASFKGLSPGVVDVIMQGDYGVYDILQGDAGNPTPKDIEILNSQYHDVAVDYGYHEDDEFEAIYDKMESLIYDIYGGMDESRDIEHANTPNERVADVDVVTHGVAGGLNKPKRMHKPAAGGDNAMQRPMEDIFNEEMTDGPTEQDLKILRDPNFDMENYSSYDLSPYMASEIGDTIAHYSHGEGQGGWDDVWQSLDSNYGIFETELTPDQAARNAAYKEEDKYKEDEWNRVIGATDSDYDFEKTGYDKYDLDLDKKEEVDESVDNFLNLYKEFSIRGEKK